MHGTSGSLSTRHVIRTSRSTLAATLFCSAAVWHIYYVAMQHMLSAMFHRELKKGSAELLILSLVEPRPRHGYDLYQLIESRSQGALRFNAASMYPLLYRLERRRWIKGRWVEKDGRRRRFYRITPEGRKVLAAQLIGWQAFVHAITRITGGERA
jgi:PadR family transcriptional regulator PadR